MRYLTRFLRHTRKLYYTLAAGMMPMFERFLRTGPIDIRLWAVGAFGNVLGITALVVLIIGPATVFLSQLAPSVWRIVLDYHFLAVAFLLLAFGTIGRLVAGTMYSATRRTLEMVDRRLLSWLSHDMGKALALFGCAALATLTLTVVFDISWRSGGGGLPDVDEVGLIETGFTFLMAVGLVSSLGPYGFLRPKIAKRKLAWCMLMLEISIAVAVGSFTYFALIHRDELTSAGLGELWIWAGLALSVAILWRFSSAASSSSSAYHAAIRPPPSPGRALRNSVALMALRSLSAMWLAVVTAGCTFSCENEVLREIASPDGAYIATVFERDCGATTDYARIVAVRKKTERFRGDKSDDVFVIRGQEQVGVRWEDARHVVITRPQRTDAIFKQLGSWNEVQVSYRPD